MRLEPPSWWYGERIPLAAWALWPIAAVYGGIVERRFRTARPYRSKLPVLCVGNFTMGGAGKTSGGAEARIHAARGGDASPAFSRGVMAEVNAARILSTAQQTARTALAMSRCF